MVIYNNKEDVQEDILTSTDIAVIGLSCRFPGADNPEQFWNNLKNGIESIQQFSKKELETEGVTSELLNNSCYVKRGGIINNIEQFDAKFFGYNATDAKMTDPQQRVFLECAYEALELSGYSPEKYSGIIAVYASMADSTYLHNNLLNNKVFLESHEWMQTRIATSITTLSTQLSYRLNLKGPSVNIVTACSSSLVSIIHACKSLIDYDCDIAIAGASAIKVPQKTGYLYQAGGIESPDGHCRAFDSQGRGTVFSNGVGVVILKRLQDAINDRDNIWAVVRGGCLNNDGADKVGYTAPSVNGQAKCIASALTFVDISADFINYVEAHGTGTELGDPIELAALINAFHSNTHEKQYCAIGSVKTNIGHTDITAGMASFIKTVLALKYKLIPPSLHFKKPNSKIDFDNSPFYVNTELKEWKTVDDNPRRAGINSSGIGGTNAFIILEEFEENKKNSVTRPYQLLLWSAKTPVALEKMIGNFSEYLSKIRNKQSYNLNDFADIAFTLQVGRTDFNHRSVLLCRDINNALSKLENSESKSTIIQHNVSNNKPKIVFMFSGQGAQYIGMSNALYHSEPQFAEYVDTCLNCLNLDKKKSLKQLLFSNLRFCNENADLLTDTKILQPALFIIEYSIAKLFMDWGIKPDAMIGHSIGEYVAACLSGVMSLKEAIELVCIRAQLMSGVTKGSMLAIALPEAEVVSFLDDNLSLSVINSPSSCVVSGDDQSINNLEIKLKELDIQCKKLRTSHAFHSYMMDPILNEFKEVVKKITLSPPMIPFVSNVTGNFVSQEVMHPDYWVQHLRQTVKFSQGLQTLLIGEYNVFAEIGPGNTLVKFAKELIQKKSDVSIFNVLPTAKEDINDQACILSALAHFWLYGVQINWSHFYENEKRFRVALPTYPFERQTYWISPDVNESQLSNQRQPYQKWFYEPSWIRGSLSLPDFLPKLIEEYCWIIFMDKLGIGELICNQLEKHNQLVITVQQGEQFSIIGDNQYGLNIRCKKDYEKLLNKISETNDLPLRILHLFNITSEHNFDNLDLEEVENTTYLSFYSLLFFVQAYTEKYSEEIDLLVIGNELFNITGCETVYPAKLTMIGPCRVVPQEHPNIQIRILDISLETVHKSQYIPFCNQIILESLKGLTDIQQNIFAYRGKFSWMQTFRPINLTDSLSSKLKANGIYLFTGGLGGISLTLSKSFAEKIDCPHLILISRSPFPIEQEWESWLRNHSIEDSISKKILKLKEIQTLGAKITILQSDIMDVDKMKSTLDKIRKNIGPISGIVHAAGIAGGGLIQLKTPGIADKVLDPKVKGTYILTHLLRDDKLNFFIMCSSVASITPELSQVDYCGANACLESFIHTNILKNVDLFSVINWTTWREVGMAVETERPDDVTFFDRNNDISPLEGAQIFSDILSNSYQQVIVSAFDINTFIKMVAQNREVDTVGDLVSRDTVVDNEEYIAPTNDIESKLAEIWQSILGIDKISITDDFFELGGHSLMALRLLSKIEKQFNTKISLQTLQKAKTVQQLAKHIRPTLQISQSQSILVPIRLEGNKAPLFCVHPVAGTIFCYIPLAKHLTFDCPVYGLQDPSIEGDRLIFSSMQEMASNYVEAIKQIQPKGPYYLCGLSFGGTLALEISHLLRRSGEKIKILVLFDGWAKYADCQGDEQFSKKKMHEQMMQVDNPETFIELAWQRMKLLLNHEPSVIDDKITLFKAEMLRPEYEIIDHKYNYWDNYTTQNIELYTIPGDHETILQEPNVGLLAKQLDTILNSCE